MSNRLLECPTSCAYLQSYAWREDIRVFGLCILLIITQSCSLEPPTKQQWLPTELLLQILSYLDDTKDLLSLSRSSKVLRTIALPALYSKLYIEESSSVYQRPRYKRLESLIGFLNFIPSSDIAVFITEFRVELVCCNAYPWEISYPQRQSTPKGTCDSHDNLAGAAMKTMINLKILRIECRLHENSTCHRHAWINDLEMLQLRYLSFLCYCGPYNTVQPPTFFSAPILASVQALDFHWNHNFECPTPWLSSLVDDASILPKLDALSYHGSPLGGVLMTKRSIQRLDLDCESRVLIDTPPKSHGTITHITSSYFPVFTILFLSVPHVFRNLRHIGVINSSLLGFPGVFSRTL